MLTLALVSMGSAAAGYVLCGVMTAGRIAEVRAEIGRLAALLKRKEEEITGLQYTVGELDAALNVYTRKDEKNAQHLRAIASLGGKAKAAKYGRASEAEAVAA